MKTRHHFKSNPQLRTFLLGLFAGLVILMLPVVITLATNDTALAKAVGIFKKAEPTPTPYIIPAPAFIPQPVVTTQPKTTVKKVAPTPTPNDPNAIIKCSISATCGGGIKEMTKSECDKVICCQINNQWVVTSKDNCHQTQNKIYFQQCKDTWEQYRVTAMGFCNINGPIDQYESCINKAGQTANDEIAKCSQ